MPIIAESADGTQHEFPEGTEQSVIDQAMKRYASEAPPAPATATETKKELPWYQKMSHGFAAPIFGLDMLASQIEQHLPFVPKETAAQDLEAAKKQQKEFSESSTPGFSAWEMAGGLLNPAYYAGGPVRGAGLLENVGRSALAGGKVGAIQPREAEDYWTHATLGAAGGATVGGIAGAALQPLTKAIVGNSPAEVDRFILDNFSRGVKPGTKSTVAAREQYNNSIASSIGSIVDNKSNLLLSDEHNNIVQGQLPQTLDQFSQAIHQTQSELFRRYNYMVKEAGDMVRVDLHPVAKELDVIAKNKATQDFSPAVAKYAEHMAESLRSRDMYTPLETQEAIQHLNSMLSAFYKGPTYETANRAPVDAMVANQLRAGLDKTIEEMVGPGYQGLKNQYGALRAIEKDVVQRAMKEAGQRGHGLSGNIGDIASAHSVISGVMHLHPATVASGIGLGLFTHATRYLRSPNRAVSRLFEAAEAAKGLPPSPVRQGVSDALLNLPTVGAIGATQP